MKKTFSFLLVVCLVAMMLVIPGLAVEPDPSVESAIAAAEAAAALEASGESSAVDVDAAADTVTEGASSEPSEEASGEASGGFSLSIGTGEVINVLSSALLLPLCFLSIILWFFRAYGQAQDNKNNIWLKIYKVLRKIHIPVGAATILLGLYHAIYASIKHGFSLNWGTAAMIFFLLGFLSWVFRKQLKRRWIVLHRFTTLIATMCMMIHAAPYLSTVFKYIVPMVLRQIT